MKSIFCLLILFLAAGLARAQTNLPGLLQQGMFEEEANHNLPAAMANYQQLANQFDQDRQLAATAIFRLGECYREGGDTNNAVRQYQRILREFPDQQTLVTLSQQDLAGMGIEISKGAPSGVSDANIWNKVKGLPESDLEKVLPTLVPDPILTLLLQQRDDAEAKLADLKNYHGPASPDIQAQTTVLSVINRQITGKIGGMMEALKIQYAESSPGETSISTDEEAREIQRIQEMIQNSPDLINAPDDHGHTPLENAAIHGWLKVAAFLLDHGADVNAGKFSALNLSANAGNRALVEFLLSHGADINTKAWTGETPLHTAASEGYQAVTEALIANKADLNAQDDYGDTPLLEAARNGHQEVVSTLLNAGANPNTADKDGRTPLSWAADSGSPGTVKAFLVAKADPNAGTMDAPLLCAVDKQDTASAELLLQSGANPDVDEPMHCAQGSYGSKWYHEYSAVLRSATPLWLAIQERQLSLVQLLLKYKANPDAQISEPPPVIFWAVPDTNVLEELLDAGANPNMQTANGTFPLAVAVSDDNVSAVQILLRHGANPNQSRADGNFPLHLAIDHFNPAIFQALLDQGADPNRKGSDGKTPLNIFEGLASGSFSLANVNVLPDRQRTLAASIADLLRRHGALEVLPDWDHIIVSSSGSDPAATFSKDSNDWNQFTLFETIFKYLQAAQADFHPVNSSENSGMPFPDLSQIRIIRPHPGTTNVTVIKINLLSHDGGIECSKDEPLKFGDTVQISQREHILAESDTNLPAWLRQISDCLKNKAGSAQLIVDGGQSIQIGLGQFGPLGTPIGQILAGSQAQNVLTSNSDLSHLKVIRKTIGAKAAEWILDCADLSTGPMGMISFEQGNQVKINGCPNFWLRSGDVIEVPQKQ